MYVFFNFILKNADKSISNSAHISSKLALLATFTLTRPKLLAPDLNQPRLIWKRTLINSLTVSFLRDCNLESFPPSEFEVTEPLLGTKIAFYF
jgi:hypothetical protein